MCMLALTAYFHRHERAIAEYSAFTASLTANGFLAAFHRR